MRFHQIVIGVDFSQNCHRALSEAVRLQRDAHTGLIAVHIVEKQLVGDLKRHLEMGEEEIRSQAEIRLQHWVAGIAGPDHTVACEAVIADPFEGLMHAVERHQADLLVLGSRGFQAEGGHPGAVASKCIRKAGVDVMLVRRAQEGPFKRVVACVDMGDGAARTVDCACAIAATEGAACDLLHVFVPRALSDLALDPFPPATDLRWLEVMEGNERTKFRAAIGDHAIPSGPATPVFQTAGDTTDGIIAYLRENKADLAVLGTRGRTGLRMFLLGTTAERLIHEAPCSLLVVKHP